MNNQEKPWWKRWWFILIVIFLLFAIGKTAIDGGDTTEKPEETTTKQTPTEEAKEATTSEGTSVVTNILKDTPKENTPEEDNPVTVKFDGQEWECLPVPEDTMSRIMEGDKWDDGAHATVETATMVEGADNNFIAANIAWEGNNSSFTASFTTAKDSPSPITSASKGTSKLFSWPVTPGGPYDGTKAAEECLSK